MNKNFWINNCALRVLNFTLRRILTCIEFFPSDRATDSLWLRAMYKLRTGFWLNLKSPRSFNEKMQWLKLHDRQSEYSILADKFSVRAFVREKIGDKYLVPLLAVFESADHVDFAKLPSKFILKGSHGSGMNVICLDKQSFDEDSALLKLKKWTAQNYYDSGREWVYKDIQPRIVCERLIEWGGEGDLPDYKFFCFGGEPLYIQVDIDRFSDHSRNMYDVGWNLQPFELHYPRAKRSIPRPENLSLMVDLAKKLSAGIPFVRVDFYDTGTHVYFGEMTFYPGNGMEMFIPNEWNLKLGELLALPERGGSKKRKK